MTLVLWNRHLAGPWSASDFRLQRYDNNSQVSSKLPNLIKSKKCLGNNFYIYVNCISPCNQIVEGGKDVCH